MLIKGAMICDANGEYKGDIRIKDDKIIEINRSIIAHDSEEILEANGLVAMPSAIDLNVQLQSFNKENLINLSHKAALGGISLLALTPNFPDSFSAELGIELLNTLQDSFEAQILGLIQNGFENISALHKKGAKGIYAKSSQNGNALRIACDFALMFDIPIFFECEDVSLSANGVMNEGKLSSKLGLLGINELSETKEVAMISELARFMGTKSVFNSIASIRSLEILKNIKKLHSSLFIQTSIHHLILTENHCNNYNTLAKIKPPLKSEETRSKLVNYLKTMDIDLLTSLQFSQPLAQKDLPFDEAAFGIDMIEYFMPMCYTLMVKTMHMSLKDLSKILSLNPAKIMGLNNYGLLKEGYYADLVLFNPKESQVINNIESPYYDWVFSGKVKEHFIKGKRVIKEN